MKNTILLLVLSFCFIKFTSAKGIKFGKISKEEIELKECLYEKDASAVVLSRTCSVDLSYSMIRYFYHVRIKILNEDGLDKANVTLSYYAKNNTENITGVKAHTINLDEKGKPVITELSGKSIFNEKINEHTGEVRFSLPNVKVGSIIEYKYKNNSRFYSYLDTWYFQDDIPTLYSAIKVNMPDSFRYNLVLFGDQLRAKYAKKQTSEWIMTNMSSIKEEAYVNNYRDFIEHIRFQLAGYYRAGKGLVATEFVNTMTTFEELAKEYMANTDFLGRRNFAKKKLETILDGSENSWAKLEKIYDYVRTNVKWNEKYRIYPKKSAPTVIENREGNNAEINYLLVLLLREAGFKCNPALARSNFRGLLQKDYPLISQFDQVLACVELYGKHHFLNATSLYRPYNLLDEEDLNYHAFVLEKGNPHWAKIKAVEKNNQNVIVTYNYTNLENPKCKIQLRETGYMAAFSRENLADNGAESWMENYLDLDNIEFSIDSLSFKNEQNVNLSLQMEGNFNMEPIDDPNGEFIYLNLFSEDKSKNPFLKEKRQYRIDYNYPRSKSIVLKFILPDGFHFEDYPRGQKIELPNDSGSYLFITKNNGRELSVRTSFAINISSFSKKDYEILREFYSQMSKLMGSQIVIKRNSNS